MGCDIHSHTEVKINGRWEHYSELNIERNYPLFALLAGVRGSASVTPISDPRGLPDDVSPLTKFRSDQWRLDSHSHSYITSEEMGEVEEFIKKQIRDGWFGEGEWKTTHFLEDILGYCLEDKWSDFHNYPDKRPKGLEDVRFVFWFDN